MFDDVFLFACSSGELKRYGEYFVNLVIHLLSAYKVLIYLSQLDCFIECKVMPHFQSVSVIWYACLFPN